MRIGLFTWGSEGDVRPFVALGAALVKRGHDVELSYVLINGTDLTALCAQHGIRSRFVAQSSIAEAFHTPGPHQDVLCGRGSPLKQVQSVLAGLLDPVTEEMFLDAQEHLPKCDVAVVHLLHHPAASVATKHAVPLVYVLTAPTVPSREFPPIGAPNAGPFNLLIWRAAERLAGGWFLPRVNALRRRLELPELTRMYPEPNTEIALGLTCISPTLFTRPRDWPSYQHVPGFFDLPVPAAAMPAALETFLNAGDAPVLITFGSMLARAAPETSDCLNAMFEAVRALGVRAIVQVPEHARDHTSATDHIFVATALPHALVMQRCALIVHHGGAGTTQAAVRAGRPSVVVPFMADQFFWATQLRQLGVVSQVLPRRRLSATRLAAAITKSRSDNALSERAQKLGEQLRAEDGTAEACRLIETLDAGRRR